MERETVERQLIWAENAIKDGERHIARQHELIAHLEQTGQDTTEAVQVLHCIEKQQALRRMDRKRLRAMLDHYTL